jgi:hypothetical protein
LTVPTISPEDNKQSIIDHSGKRIALEDMPTAQDGVLQNDTLQNIDRLHLREPIDLSLDDDSPNKEDVYNSDEQSLFSDSFSTDDLESNDIPAPIILSKDELFCGELKGTSVQFVNKETTTLIVQHYPHFSAGMVQEHAMMYSVIQVLFR